MITHLPVIILAAGAAIVPLLLWMFGADRHDPARDDIKLKRPSAVAPVSPAKQEGRDDASHSYVLLQLRPDGVVLDWRNEPSVASPSGLSVTRVTDTTGSR